MPVIDHDPIEDLRPVEAFPNLPPRDLLMMEVLGEIYLSKEQRKTLIALLPYYHPKVTVTVSSDGRGRGRGQDIEAIERMWERSAQARRMTPRVEGPRHAAQHCQGSEMTTGEVDDAEGYEKAIPD
jgi:hypothetical protein